MPEGDTPAPARPEAISRAEKLNTRAAGVVGVAVLTSRVLGLAREQIFAALFGGGRVMDAFTIAFRIPNLLRDLFAEGALSTAFVTVFTRTATLQDAGAAWRLANKVATLTVITLSAITIVGIVVAPALVALLAPGFDPAKAALTVTLTRIMWPFILLVSLAALVMGMLNSRNVFGMPAMASSFFNLGSIVAGVVLGYWLDPHFGPRAILGLAIGTLIGGALQLLVQLPTLAAQGYRFHPDLRWRDPGVGAILRLMGPSVVAASTTQVNVLVNSVFASELGDGPTFWLTVAFRLMQLPLGIFGVALGTVALPLLARMAATGNTHAFRSELARGMRLAFLNWVFTRQLGWGHRGLAFSTACVATSNFLILYFLMRAQLGRLESRAMLVLLAKVALASAVLFAVCWVGAHYLLSDWAVLPFWPKCASLTLVIVTAAAAFFLCASALGIGEVHDITAALRRRLRRAASGSRG